MDVVSMFLLNGLMMILKTENGTEEKVKEQLRDTSFKIVLLTKERFIWLMSEGIPNR